MMTLDRTARWGATCVDDSQRVVFSSGLGAEPAIRALAVRRDWVEEIKVRRVACLKLNGSNLSLLYFGLVDGYVILTTDAVCENTFEFLASVDFAFDIFEQLVSDPFNAMTVVDTGARLRYISPVHEKFFGLRHGEANGKPVKSVIENTRLHEVVRSGKAEIGHIQKIGQTDRVVSRIPIRRDKEIVGAIGRVMFSGPDQVDTLNRRINSLESEVEFYRREADALRRHDYGMDSIVGSSPAIEDLKARVAQVAPMDVSVLIHGESGVGEELVAQALHRLSQRKDSPHVVVNAAALPATLVESELFGYVPGAFTGAHHKGYAGKFEQANKGTIFLDEIGDMPLEVQAKLLRVLQEGTVERLGGETSVQLDFRLVTATNRNLRELVEDDRFRLDLFYRISPVVLEVPPLRERGEDVLTLARHFLTEFAERHRRETLMLDDSACRYLLAQDWPGNVRQLKHEVERAAIFAVGAHLTASDLSQGFSPRAVAQPPNVGNSAADETDLHGSLGAAVSKLEARMIKAALKRNGGNKKMAAEELKISRNYFYKRLKELDLAGGM